MGDPFLALGDDGAAYDFPERMLAGVPAQWFMEKKLSKPGIGLGFFDPAAFASTSAASTGRRSRARAPITVPARPAISKWTKPISRPAARSPCRYW